MNLSNAQKALYYDRKRDIDLWRHHNDSEVYFGSVSSGEYGLYLTDIHAADTPKRDVSFLSVPGRNGDLIVDNRRWHNLDIIYSFAIATGFSRNFDGFKAALLAQNGYQKLYDSIYPELFRMAVVKEAIQPETMRFNRSGTFEVAFHCKPQRFLASGQFPISLTEYTKLHGTGFPAKPLITVYGSGAGTLTIGNTTVVIKDMDDQLTLDCELQTAYRQIGDGALENKNGCIYAPSFPELPGGDIPISWTGGVTKIELIPRWWII